MFESEEGVKIPRTSQLLVARLSRLLLVITIADRSGTWVYMAEPVSYFVTQLLQ